jgi:hypothetical protein
MQYTRSPPGVNSAMPLKNEGTDGLEEVFKDRIGRRTSRDWNVIPLYNRSVIRNLQFVIRNLKNFVVRVVVRIDQDCPITTRLAVLPY